MLINSSTKMNLKMLFNHLNVIFQLSFPFRKTLYKTKVLNYITHVMKLKFSIHGTKI